MSAPMPNPFDPNSTSHVPVDVESAAANSCPQPLAAAALSFSDGVPVTSLTKMEPSLAHAPSETEGAVSRAASSDNIDHINEIFFYARKLIAEDGRFVLDEALFLAEIDEEPLFLRSAV